MTEYEEFIGSKSQWKHGAGFDCEPPSFLYDFQKYLVAWAWKKGRALISSDCGSGKTAMQLAWADEIVRRTNRHCLLCTPLAVGAQTIREAEKFGIDASRSRDGKISGLPRIWVTNYEQLHKFDHSSFGSFVGDESSGIKNFKSERKKDVVEFTRQMEYRLLCTATAAPNDFWELGTSSEALGLLGFRDMVTTFFRQETQKDHLGWGRTKYRFRGHAEQPFWSWVCSWARSMRLPSDLGFEDKGFALPELIEQEIVVTCEKARDGYLFALPGLTIQDERAERRNSIDERCKMAADIAHGCDDYSVIWCELNDEGDQLTRMIEGAVQIKGSLSEEEKEERLIAFSTGEIKRLVLKPKIGAWGLNWQHCNNVISLPSHSYEQYYQAVRRCYRFGQKRPVKVSLIVNEGEVGILANLRRKAYQADTMFRSIVSHMRDAMHLATQDFYPEKEEVPKWLS